MTSPNAKTAVAPVQVMRFQGSEAHIESDLVVAEEPLEIRIGFGPEATREQKNISVTLRTPGHDFDLAIGFLYSEGIIQSPKDIHSVNYCQNVDQPEAAFNIVKVELSPECQFDGSRLDRHFYTTSSCGICGKTSLEAVQTLCPVFMDSPKLKISPPLIYKISESILEQQKIFTHTGGLHAAGMFDLEGKLIALREDVGRHNAVDKLIGGFFMQGKLPLSEHILFVSGRAGFELVQKAAMAGIQIMAAVGAPSSLSVGLAKERGISLIGFLRNGRFNLYSGFERFE